MKWSWILHKAKRYYFAQHNPSIRMDLDGNVYGGGILFDGVDDLINVDGVLSNPTKLSISLWAKNTGSFSSAELLFAHRSEVTRLLQITYQDSTTILFQMRGSGNSLQTLTYSSATAANWNHIVATFDRVGDSHKLYVNGVLRDSSTYDFGSETFTSTKQTIGGTYATEYQNHWEGPLTEVALWSDVLTQDDVDQLYNSKIKHLPLQIQPANLVAYWPLDDLPDGKQTQPRAYDHAADPNCIMYYPMNVNEDPIQDETTSNIDLALSASSTPVFTEGVAGGGAYSFDGPTSSAGGGDIILLDGLSSMTVMVWIKMTALGTNGKIITKWGSSNAERTIFLEYIQSTPNEIRFGIKDDPTGNDQLFDANASIVAGAWAHVAGVFSSVNTGVQAIYVNGISSALEQVINDGGVTALKNGINNFYIGAQADEPDASINGLIDKVAIYKTALTPAQMLAIYRTTGPRFRDLSGNGNHGDGQNGVLGVAEEVLSYPGAVFYPTLAEAVTAGIALYTPSRMLTGVGV